MWLREFLQTHPGFRVQQAQQEKDRGPSNKRRCSSFKMSSPSSRFVDPVKPCQSTCLCHRSAEPVHSCWIDLPSTSLRFQWAQWENRAQPIEKMRLLSTRFGNEARSKWPLRSHDHRIWLTRLFLHTDVSPTHQVHWPREPSRKPLWERLSAELDRQPCPLTPVFVEIISAVLSKAGCRSAHLHSCVAQQRHRRLLKKRSDL